MDTRKNRWKGNHLVGKEDGLSAGLLAALAGTLPRRSKRSGPERRGEGWSAPEALEPRILLDGDHPEFPIPFDPDVGTVVAIDDGTGQGTAGGTISPPVDGNADDDFFRFSVATRDFVTVLANTAGLSNTLNTAITVYNSSGTQVAVGTSNGRLTSVAPGVAPDGWAGFIAEPGDYYVRVVGENGTTGDYELRIDTTTTDTGATVPLEDDAENRPFQPTIGEFWVDTAIDVLQGETIFFMDVPEDEAFNGLASITTKAPATILDARLEVYNAAGELIAADSDLGYLNNSFVVFPVQPGDRIYVRVRSDDLLDTQQSLGDVTLRVDLASAELATPVDPVTRRGAASGVMLADTSPIEPDVLIGPTDFDLYTFQAQGTGLTFVTLADLATEGGFGLYLYDETGTQIAFDDDFVGNTPQIEVDLVGGERYWVVVASFEPPQTPVPLDAAPYQLFIEAHHTTDETVGVDDHVDTPPGGISLEEARRQFGLATSLRWNDARLLRDANGNPIYDHNWVTEAQATGRVHDADDTDLYTFVPPVNMMGSYEGNNDDEGTAIYAGGRFRIADPESVFSTNSASLATWDAGDWWFVGSQGTEELPFGFIDNDQTPGTDAAEVYALYGFQQENSTGQPILIVGGDFTLVLERDPATGDITKAAQNLAAWGFNPNSGRYQWYEIGSPDGPVHAITEYDPVEFDSNGDEPDGEVEDPAGNRLFIGGEFTSIQPPGNPPPPTIPANNIAAFTLAAPLPFDIDFVNNVVVGGWEAVGTGTTGPVYALAVYDPADPGDRREATDDLTEVDDTPDPPLSLFIGGDFPTAGGVNAQNLATWNGVEWGEANYGTPTTNGDVDGPVRTLTVWDPPDPADGGDGESRLGDPLLVVGGEFEHVGTMDANNIFVYGRVANVTDGDANSDPEVQLYRPRLLFEALGTGTDAGVFTAITIPHFDPDGTENGQNLVIGGAFTTVDGGAAAHIAMWDNNVADGAWSQPFGAGFDDTVFSLAAVADIQEPGVADEEVVIHAAGAFEGHVARFNAAFGRWDPLNSGTDDTVFVLAAYDDGNPNEWDRNDRPSMKATITVSPTDGAFLNAFVRVFDSNLNIIYENDTKSPFPDPAGSIDPSLSPVASPFVIPELWAGETYYIEVSSATQGFRNTGRYTLSVIVDAVAPDVDDDGAPDHPTARPFEEPDAGEWEDATPINVDDNVHGDGSNRNFVESQPSFPTWPFFPPPSASGTNGQVFSYPRTPTGDIGATPSGFRVTEATDYGNIESIDDTDLYFFRASASGYVELRINTTDIQQFYYQRIWDLNVFPFTSEETLIPDTDPHVMSSRLQSVIRVFDNDGTEVAVSGYNPAIGGEGDVTTTGRFGERTYTHRDARLVLPVQANGVYFIQVESGQHPTFLDNPDLVDWRFATGAYELLVDAISDFTPDNSDDVANFLDMAAPIPVGIDPDDSTTNGRGTVTGVIRDVINNPNEPNDDRDLYFYYATGNGPVTLTGSALNSNVSLSIIVLNDTLGVVATGLAVPGGTITINWIAQQGERFYIQADGAGGTQGAYQLDFVGVPYVDDHADVGNWIDATELTVNTFLGTATATGRLESIGDSDVFVFTSDQWALATVTIESQSENTLDPFVRVYEIQTDPLGNPFLAQILFNDDTPLGPDGNRNSFGRFSVSPDRTYYIVVDGFDPNLDFGNYQLTARVAPSDDHPNFQFFPLATVLNPTTNASGFAVANATGRIEVEADDDVFRFVAAARGNATVTLTRTSGDIDPVVRILNSAGADVTGSPANDDATPGVITITFEVLRGQTYYIVVDADVGGGTGEYSLALQAPANDDHANALEFNLASVITISSTTGIGARSGTVNPSVDTDLFRFAARVVGNATITVTTDNSTLNPRIQVFTDTFQLIAGATDDAETASQVVNATTVGQVFYVLVLSDNVGGGTPTGNYEVRVQQVIDDGGGPGPEPGEDDHTNAGNFAGATPVPLDSRTGDGSAAGVINTVGDTDLFRFTTPALTNGQSGLRPVFLQVTTPSGGLIDGLIRVYTQNAVNPGQFDLVDTNSNGTPGNTASLTFNAPGNTVYYVLVEPVGASTGSYSLRIDTEPDTHYLYYPEGYTANTIDEFVPIVNPNNFDVTYTVVARYEVGERDQILLENIVIPANSRGGFTVASRNQESLTRRDTPYALEIRSNGQLGATFAHYDFGVTTGENFTNRISTQWTFAQVNRDGIADPAALGNLFNDYVLFYNPNDADVTVDITLVYDNGAVTTFTRSIGALRRGGLNFDTDDAVTTNGRFSVRLSASAPIVAAMSSYDIQNGRGFGILGDADAGATEGVITNISSGNGVESAIGLFNSTSTTASVTITISYTQANLPDLVRVVSLTPNSRRTYSLADLGVIAGQAVGIHYTSSVAITLNAIEYKNGDGDASTAATRAGTTAIFGDAFVTPEGAGNTYIEQIGLYNPSGTTATVAIRFLFTDGTTSAPVNVTVGAGRFSLFQVDQAAAVLNGPSAAFSIRLDSVTPFVASFTHYDLFLGGGWSTTGSLIGLTNSLATIS